MTKKGELESWAREAGCTSRPRPCDVTPAADRVVHRAYASGAEPRTNTWPIDDAERFIDRAEAVHRECPA